MMGCIREILEVAEKDVSVGHCMQGRETEREMLTDRGKEKEHAAPHIMFVLL